MYYLQIIITVIMIFMVNKKIMNLDNKHFGLMQKSVNKALVLSLIRNKFRIISILIMM